MSSTPYLPRRNAYLRPRVGRPWASVTPLTLLFTHVKQRSTCYEYPCCLAHGVLQHTPLFYIVCLFIFVGYLYVSTRRQMRRILHGQQPPMQGRQAHGFTQVRMAARHSDAVICQSCGRNVNRIAVKHIEGNKVLLCHSCARKHGQAQRAQRAGRLV